MSSSFPNGSVFAIGSAYGTAVNITAISNANPGIATAAAHGFTDSDIILLAMPSRLDGKVVRVDAPATGTFTLEGVDTSSTTLYPSGFGVGTAKEVTTFTPLSQVVDSQSSGGEQQFYQWVYLEEGRQRQRPTFTNARSFTLTLDYDPDLAWHAALLAAAISGEVKALRAQLPNLSKLYWGVYVGFDGEPTFTINENQKVTLSLSLASTHTRYAT
jgi:hypothetical protein